MKNEKLDWSWFNPLQCWEALFISWTEGELKNNLTSHGRIKRVINGEGKESKHTLKHGREREEERFWLSFPCNADLRSRFQQGKVVQSIKRLGAYGKHN